MRSFFTYVLFLLISTGAHAQIFFGAEDQSFNFNESVRIEPLPATFTPGSAEAALVESVRNNLLVRIEKEYQGRRITNSVIYRRIVQRPLTLVKSVSQSRTLNFNSYLASVRGRFEGVTLTISKYKTPLTPAPLFSFDVLIVDENGEVAKRIPDLSPETLDIHTQTLVVRASPWLSERIKQFYADARRLSLPHTYNVRLQLKSRAYSRDWDLSTDDLLDFLSLRRFERFKFRCARSLRPKAKRQP